MKNVHPVSVKKNSNGKETFHFLKHIINKKELKFIKIQNMHIKVFQDMYIMFSDG